MKNNWTRLKERLIPELKAAKDAKTLRMIRSSIKSNSWFRWTVFYEIPYYLKYLNIVLFDISWEIKYRTTKKYHIVNTKLNPSYYDSSTLMLHACFSLLEDYVEKELGGISNLEEKMVDDKIFREVYEIYSYWKSRGNPLLKYDLIDSIKDEEQKDELNDKEQEMLLRLVSIREDLWG